MADLPIESSPDGKPIQSIDFAPDLVRQQSQELEHVGIHLKTVPAGHNFTQGGTNQSATKSNKRDFKVRIINGSEMRNAQVQCLPEDLL